MPQKRSLKSKEVDLKQLTSTLDWKQFESLATFAFECFGYSVIRNYRLKKPSMEIDLVAMKNSCAFAADCKHWKSSIGSLEMLRISERQVERSRRMGKAERLEHVVPLIISWRQSAEILENGVPVIPVETLEDFILNFDASTSGVLVI